MKYPVNADRIPEALKGIPRWVLWREIQRSDKPTKCPFAIDGTPAKSTDAATWASFDDVTAKADPETTGIGFVLSDQDNILGIDLDGCRNPESGELSEWAREIVTNVDCYAEVSPSKTGVKMFVRGQIPEWSRKRTSSMNVERVSEKEPGIELYSTGRFFTITGARLACGRTIEDRQTAIDSICGQYLQSESIDTLERARRYVAAMGPAISGQRGHDHTFKAACRIVHGFNLSESEALQLLTEWNQHNDEKWTVKELTHKINSAVAQSGERGYLLGSHESQWRSIEARHPVKPQTTTAEIRTFENIVATHLEEIENNPTQLLETGLPELDYAIGGGYQAGEMIVHAARPSHGKSALSLQFLHHATATGQRGLMISEEMSSRAVAQRITQFASSVPVEHWSTQLGEVHKQVATHFSERDQCYFAENCRTVDAVCETIRSSVLESQVTIVVVDYTQLLDAKGGSTYERVSNVSRSLRQVTSETGIALIALAQLNRAIESREVFVPRMNDLKDSGQLEQDADVVLFGVWPHRLNSEKPRDEYQIFVGKNRNRAINSSIVNCAFDPTRQMFFESFKPVQIRDAPKPYTEFESWS